MSKPFLCECGNLLNVSEIPPGSRFSCPSCGVTRLLDLSDPGMLASFTDSEGVYNLMLKKKLSEAPTLDAQLVTEGLEEAAGAVAVEQRTSDTRTSPGPMAPGSPGVSPGLDPDAPGLQSGEDLGPFRIEQLLGRGGMGAVYEAFDNSLQRKVALKVLGLEHSRNTELIDRFQREARACGALTHPNITHIYSIGEDRAHHYFAMELIRGRTLAQILEDERRISEENAIDYMLQVGRGLRAAKRKEIIHRDLKPSNLILSEHGLVKITDFGLAKVVTSPIDITATGVIIGTPLYMSPEQGKGEPLDHRSDIYSLGCTFYHLLCGSPPFSGETAMSIIVQHITEEPKPLEACISGVSPRLIEIIQRMISKNPLDRFQDYDKLIEALSQVTSSPSSSRIETNQARIVLRSETHEESIPGDSMSLKQLSVADVNLELGRYEKALALYRMVLEDNPELEVDLSFRMLRIYQERGDEESCRELQGRILELSSDPRERFFCRWKQLRNHYEACLEEMRDASASLERMLEEEVPDGVHEKRLRQRLDELLQMQKKLARDCEGRILLIRKTGDLQIELD